MAKRSILQVGPAPYTAPGATELVVRSRAVAINPLDWITQSLGDVFFPWIKYPFVLGSDVAGEVVAVGSSVARFKIGDRVLGHAVGLDKNYNTAAQGSFQTYTVLLENMAAPIPPSLRYEHAAVLPLALSTAACGLFQKDQLALDYPSVAPVATGKTVLIWGGSTSVGMNAIQLAVAAGYRVIATASPRNFSYLQQLGADQVFDYASKSVARDIIAAFEGRTLAGALALGSGSASICVDIVRACQGDKVVSIASAPVSFEKVPMGRGRAAWLAVTLPRLMASMAPMLLGARLSHIRTGTIFSTTIADNEVSRIIYETFLPTALADARYIAAPEPMVFGHGLDQIQPALDAHRAGVSARKLVVLL